MSIQELRDNLNIVVDLIPRSNSNRPGTPLAASKITIHNTDNESPGAGAQAHARYQKGADAQQRRVSWHFTVDDHSVYQSLPVDEVGWHAGSHEGNSRSLGVEICENRGIDQEAANQRAAELTALLLREHGLALTDVVQHNHWSGKDCPFLLRHPESRWNEFLAQVERAYGELREGAQENRHGAPVHLTDVNSAPSALSSLSKAPESISSGGDAPAGGGGGGGTVQTNILSTEFGGGSEAGMPSAYGGTVNPNEPQASLPARVPQSQRRLRVTNPANDQSVICLVNDVGPWNTHDAYWKEGRRPAAEAQHRDGEMAENGRVPSNSAGLDLTPAALLALGVHGAVNTRAVRVNWQFA